MNTQTISTLQVSQALSSNDKSHFLHSCPKEFIRFLCECLIKLLKGNLQAVKRRHVVKFQDEVWLLLLKWTTWKQRRNVLSSEKGLQIIAVITPPVINHLSWYGSVCSCPGFCLYEPPPTYQSDAQKRDINKKLFGEADTLKDKILSGSRIKLSNSQTLSLDGVDTGVLTQTLLYICVD